MDNPRFTQIYPISRSTSQEIETNKPKFAKQIYYETCFHQFRNDIRNTWRTINEILPRIKKTHKLPTVFKENGTVITDINIANKFNTFLQMSVRKLQKIFTMMVRRITVIIYVNRYSQLLLSRMLMK